MKFIALLRGINISGKNKISMSELKRELDIKFRREPLYAGENVKACALKSALDKMLDLLDEFVKS